MYSLFVALFLTLAVPAIIADIHSDKSAASKTTLVYNAVIRTLDDSKPVADAFAYTSTGKIIEVGLERDVRFATRGEDLNEVNMRGAFVMPGFQDVHTHVPEGGINMLEGIFCYLEPSRTLDEYIDELLFCEEEQPGTGWLRASGASLFELQDGPSPLKALDEYFPKRPVLVLDDLGHGAMVNSIGLKKAGIKNLQFGRDPPGGIYGRDINGNMNGLLFENAQQKARDAAKISANEMYRGLLLSFKQLARNGITSISDAGGFWTRGSVEAWRKALKSDEVTVRARNALYVYPDMPYQKQMRKLKRLFSNNKRSLVSFNTAKIYVDGILDIGSALMLKKYNIPINPDYPKGFAYFNDRNLLRYSTDLIKAGFTINYHVIGDGACRKALDTLARIPNAAKSRSRITHTYLVDKVDIPRFKNQSVIADFQMAPVAISSSYAQEIQEFIGTRASTLINVKEMYESGARVTISSDWDADPMSPLKSIKRSLSRGSKSLPNVETAVKMWTINAAYALGMAKITGSLKKEKFADYIVLDRDIFKATPQQIGKAKILQTVVGGRVVYRA